MAKHKLALMALLTSLGWVALAMENAKPFTTGTDFNLLTNGVLDVNCNDHGKPSTTDVYWSATSNDVGVVVTSNELEAVRGRYLDIDTGAPFDRLILPRMTNGLDKAGKYKAESVFLSTNQNSKSVISYTNVYADVMVKFTPCVVSPEVDAYDRIVVWMRELQDIQTKSCSTNIIVTAGVWDDKFGTNQGKREYVLTNTIAAETWCRLTIRAIADTTVAGKAAAGFTVYLNGAPAVVADEEKYDVYTGPLVSWFTSEARLLMAERRLFPSLATPKHDTARTLSRLTFSGQGAVDDVYFTSTNRILRSNIFTLNWEAGISGAFDCIVSNRSAVVTNKIDATAALKVRDFDLGTNNYAVVTITNLVIDTEGGYSNTVWTAANDCKVDGNVFTYDGKNENPIGNVRTSRNQVTIDGVTCSTFTRAKELSQESGKNLLVLATNMVMKSKEDGGVLTIRIGEDYVLDLAGHTLQGVKLGPADTTIYVSGGKLKIIDSSVEKTGRVLPPAGCITAIDCSAAENKNTNSIPTVVIEGGWYDGRVVVGKTIEKYMGECAIGVGNFTNVMDDVTNFYLENYVTNTSIYYAYQNGYWVAATNGFIWCGAGVDTKWSTAENWKGGKVPVVDDLAIFPYANTSWQVDFGTGVDITNIWMDGNIAMSGTNDFTIVKIVGAGRFVGNGQIVFSGAIPGKLTANDSDSSEVRLGKDWAGCVKLTDLSDKARTMNDITYWGTSKSTVEFNGVRGYVSDKLMHAQPYTLVLTDAIMGGGSTTNAAWKNETGYTGSVVSFPELRGTGTFESPKNLRSVNQVIQFVVVSNYTGRMNVGGKRVLLGTGPITTATSAGSIAFTSNVTVRSGCDWTAGSCTFLTPKAGGICRIRVIGSEDDVLMTCASANINGARATVEGSPDYYIWHVDGAIVFQNVPQTSVKLGTSSISAVDLPGSVKGGTTFEIPAGSAVSIQGNDVLVNGVVVATVAEYYALTPTENDENTEYSVELDSEAVTPTLADFEILSEGDGEVVIGVTNAKKGLYYAIQTNSSLKDDGWETVEWKHADGDSITLTTTTSGSTQFYRVIVSDQTSN